MEFNHPHQTGNFGKRKCDWRTYAVDDVLDVLEKNPAAGPSILHWFTGTQAQLKRAADMGCWFSIGPKMLQSAKGKQLILQMPIDKILFETDGPFTKNSNGKAFEPIDTLSFIKQLSTLMKTEENLLKEKIVGNFKSLSSFNV